MTGTERTLPAERVWVFRDQSDVLRVKLTKPDPPYQGVEYMRVLSRQEVDKLATEGVDTQQYINSLLRTIEGQRKHITQLQGRLANAYGGNHG